ncbi:hypothetical protein [Nocardia brasiliensis]|uniref:hypothetical protein n=1 Tax=Nocardia brasiliensis TaxID=37326 RepID=UPI00189369C9|nr:hypothetical protein [Nocardia brasiliensis]MBF6129108.1 hypothetical protein [Nocardia brasiliensis]
MTTGDTPMQAVPDEVKAIGKFAYDIAEQLKSGSTAGTTASRPARVRGGSRWGQFIRG